MSRTLEIVLGVGALAVVYYLYSNSNTAAATAASVLPAPVGSPLAPAPGSIAPVVAAPSAASSSSGSTAKKVGSAVASFSIKSGLALGTLGLSTSAGRSAVEGAASGVYHSIASIF